MVPSEHLQILAEIDMTLLISWRVDYYWPCLVCINLHTIQCVQLILQCVVNYIMSWHRPWSYSDKTILKPDQPSLVSQT